MRRKIVDPNDINELALLDYVANCDTSLESVEPMKTESSDIALPPSETEPKRKKIIQADFRTTFLTHTIVRDRYAVYISRDTKQTIENIIQHLSTNKVSLSGYIENVLRHHVELYKDEINREYRAKNKNEIL